MKRLSIIVIIGIFIITGCDWQRTSKEPSKNTQNQQVIKIGYLPITHSANLMMTKKLLSQYNHPKYKLELVKFNNWPDLMDALNSGRIDGASTLIELAMKSKQKGSNIKAVALGHHEGNVIIIGHYQPVLLPGPALVGKSIWTFIVTGEIFQHLAISLWRFVAGFVVALLVAIPLGFLLGRNRWLYNAIEPLFQLIRPISPIAWAPFVVLWFGIGSLPAIAIIFIAAFFPIVFNTIKGVRDIEPQYLKIAANLNLTGWSLYRNILFPGAFKQIMAGIHMAVGTSWIFLVSGEMIGAQSGLGFLIVDARNMLNLEDVLAAIFFIGLFGFIIDRFISYIEQFILRRFGE
ncbi:TPA: ABC transporter permease subunit [Staphylococcus aureus]|nr:ABC transporter permease subunit [Staphylococcus aureus]HAR2838386.1 ABC transporter permease subunit [Staphylococcus aureus]HAR2840744.1 ABC transporter permease subunit [Staphylococcus aureus]HAR2854992.1 ABC transporter permease subunit [Staphylococcus aureus]HAR2888358.1 ABC transporter permease subunit [Staphylococcus aureus]